MGTKNSKSQNQSKVTKNNKPPHQTNDIPYDQAVRQSAFAFMHYLDDLIETQDFIEANKHKIPPQAY